MGFGIDAAFGPGFPAHAFDCIHQPEDAFDVLVDLRFRDLARLYRIQERVCQEEIVEGFGRAHFHVQATFQGVHRSVNRRPVGDDDPFKTPFIPQDLVEHITVLAQVFPPEFIVGPHDAMGFCLGNGRLKSRQVDLA